MVSDAADGQNFWKDWDEWLKKQSEGAQRYVWVLC